ncbi:MAG: hypothetical protein QMC83_01490 [Thermodesulfovibrionales bacterium]|nr:hypothetical protein [Thermodesulfovibrionales bacterium]
MKRFLVILLSLLLLVSFSLSIGCKKVEKPAEAPGPAVPEKPAEAPGPAVPEKPAEAPPAPPAP